MIEHKWEIRCNTWIWDYKQKVSDGIALMKEIGLIEDYIKEKRFNAFKKDENKSYIYRYYYDNEVKFIEYCKENNIEPYKPEHKIPKLKDKRLLDKSNLKQEDVYFGSDLNLVKPDDMSKSDFEGILLYFLFRNYPYLSLISKKVDEMNERFYRDTPEFAIKFIPKIKWSNNSDTVVGISIRATNKYCNKKNRNSNERKDILKEYGFVLEKDIRSSVPRLTLSLNKREWIDESVDIYKLINDEYDHGSEFTNERREAIKELHMSAYFDRGSDKQLGKNIWYRMYKGGLSKEDKAVIDEEIGKLRNIVLKVEGGKTFDNEIFMLNLVCI